MQSLYPMHSLDTEQEFLLVCEASSETGASLGRWRFVLERLDGTPYLEASDHEPGDTNRLSLWAMLRGLEALPGPSTVTMLTSSRYVIRSLSDALPRWKAAGFEWEQFGQRLPVTNADLWRRIDRVLDIHAVSACCVAAAPRVNRRIRLAPECAVAGADVGGAVRGERPQGHVRIASISDGLRRWLVSQCRSVTGGYGNASQPHVAAA